MTKANTTFNLDIRDVELIENALNSVLTKQSSTIIDTAGNENSKPSMNNCPVKAGCTTKKFGIGRKAKRLILVVDLDNNSTGQSKFSASTKRTYFWCLIQKFF